MLRLLFLLLGRLIIVIIIISTIGAIARGGILL
jgi:hypothetical protein